MLNAQGIRELAYLVEVTDVEQMNADRLEAVCINGWRCVCEKGTFHKGDIAIFFEIDSKLPEVEPFIQNEFLKNKKFKIKSQKIRGVVSQGLLMHPDEFGWRIGSYFDLNLEKEVYYVDDGKVYHFLNDEGRFLTKQIGVTYAVEEDNVRKNNFVDKYKKMAQRHPNIFKKPWAKWLIRRAWGRKLMFFLFGKKKDKKNSWPSHIAAKTDVERVQNMVWVLNDKQPYVASEKVDGSSCSIMAERGHFGKIKYYVCSRNVVFDKEDAPCFYESNIYMEVWNKYNLQSIITAILNDYNLPNVALQMEVYGSGVQKRDYSTNEHKIAVFHIVSNGKKFPMDQTIEICEKYGLPHVPIINDNYILPDTIKELQAYVESAPSKIDGKMKEGIVFYDKATGQQYFKFVSPEYLLKFHS